MADNKLVFYWAFRLWAFLSCLIGAAVLGGMRGYYWGHAAGVASVERVEPDEPEPVDDLSKWKALPPGMAARYGLPEPPRDGFGRYKSRWRWMKDDSGGFRYYELWRNVWEPGEPLVGIEPLPEAKPKPGGKIGEAGP